MIFKHHIKLATLLASTLLLALDQNAHAAFTKLDAREQLMKSGIKWKLTETILADATAKKDQAESTFNPKLLFSMKEFYSRINPIQFGGADGQTLNELAFGTTAVELNWTLMDPLAKGELIIAENALHTAKEKTQQYQTDLTAMMIVQYLNVQRLSRQINLMSSNVKKSELIYKLAQAKKSVGAGISLDISRARNLYELDRIKLIGTINKLQKAEHELATTLGLERLPAELEELKASRVKVHDIQKYLEIALERRPDLKTARADLQTADNALKYTEGKIFPKISFIAEVGSTQTSAFGFPVKTPTGFLGVAMSVPIDSGGLIPAKKAEALSGQRKASLQVQQIRLELLQQVKEALEQILSAEEALNAAENYYKTAQEEARISEKRFEQGASNIIDYTTAHTNLSSAEDTLTESTFNYEAAKLNYFRTQGGLDDYFQQMKGSKE